jgi:TonB family protein
MVRPIPTVRRLRWIALAAAVATAGAGTARAQSRTATIAGVVRDTAGHAVPGVYVAVAGSGIRVRTNEDGKYRLVGIIEGPATLTARRLGYRPYSRWLRLDGGEERTVDIGLGATTHRLAEVAVTAPREAYDSRLEGFTSRSKLQVGHFVTRDRIDRANSTTLSDMLREIPGVKIGPTRNEGRAIRLRGANCPPLVFVDGFPATAGEFDVDIIDLKSVEGVEVYSGTASVPPEFSGPRQLDRCGVIAIWSRPARARTRAEPERAPDDRAPEPGYFTSDQVDEGAELETGTLDPQYPDSLYLAGIKGQVVVELVVDTARMVDPATVEVLSSTDDRFSDAVREALPSAHFAPARRRGRRVRQLVQLPITFGLTVGKP